MPLAEKPILLVGAIEGGSAEEVFRLVAPELGKLAIGMPDGEGGPRSLWVIGIWHHIFEEHPQLEITRQPKGIEGMPDWMPAGYHDLMKFKVKDGLDKMTFENLRYGDYAKESYVTFRKLKDQGVIPIDTKFQVSFPFPEDVVRLATTEVRDFNIISAAYQDRVVEEVTEVINTIPASELVLQFDINWEVIAVATGDGNAEPLTLALPGDPLDRYLGYIKRMCKPIPSEVTLGLHLCYGNYQHQHYVQPDDLAICTRMANAGIQAAGRRIDYVHMPVPRDRNDDAYFAPLKDLDTKGGTLFIGLMHYTDGVEGTVARLKTFNKHYSGPYGIATECGLGQRPADQDLPTLIRMHREVVEQL